VPRRNYQELHLVARIVVVHGIKPGIPESTPTTHSLLQPRRKIRRFRRRPATSVLPDVFYHFLVSSSSVLIKIKMYPTFFCCPPKLMKLSTISDRGTSAMVDRKPPCLLVLISIVLRLVLLTTNLSVSTRVRFQLPLFESDVADVSCPHARASAMDMAIKLCARA
jgi:hypothetical protein